MSQVDKLIFMPILLWFFIGIILIYFKLITIIIPRIYYVKEIRNKYLWSLVNEYFISFIFITINLILRNIKFYYLRKKKIIKN